MGKEKYRICAQGLAIGDGLCDPVSMTGYGDLLHGVGLINRFQYHSTKKHAPAKLPNISCIQDIQEEYVSKLQREYFSVQKAQFEVLESQARKFIKEEAWVS